MTPCEHLDSAGRGASSDLSDVPPRGGALHSRRRRLASNRCRRRRSSSAPAGGRWRGYAESRRGHATSCGVRGRGGRRARRGAPLAVARQGDGASREGQLRRSGRVGVRRTDRRPSVHPPRPSRSHTRARTTSGTTSRTTSGTTRVRAKWPEEGGAERGGHGSGVRGSDGRSSGEQRIGCGAGGVGARERRDEAARLRRRGQGFLGAQHEHRLGDQGVFTPRARRALDRERARRGGSAAPRRFREQRFHRVRQEAGGGAPRVELLQETVTVLAGACPGTKPDDDDFPRTGARRRGPPARLHRHGELRIAGR